MKKKQYVVPEVRIIQVKVQQVIATSSTVDDPWSALSEEDW